MSRFAWSFAALTAAFGLGGACNCPHKVEPSHAATAAETPPHPAWKARITAERLRSHVETLAADALGGRATPSPGLDRAASHLATTFRKAGLVPDGAAYRQRLDCDRTPGGEANAANVVAQRVGSERPNEVVLVTAHYDHLGAPPAPTDASAERAPAEDTIFNGANDNASGVAAMLVIAEALRDVEMARTVRFIGFCGEELGLVGSTRYVEQQAGRDEHIIGVVNLEMLGRPTPGAPPTLWVTGMPYSTLPQVFSDISDARFIDATQVGPVEGGAFARSDNYPFARAGIPAHTFATGRIDAMYHSVDDEPDSLDYAAMVPRVRALAVGVHRLANDDFVPTFTPAGFGAGFGDAAH